MWTWRSLSKAMQPRYVQLQKQFICDVIKTKTKKPLYLRVLAWSVKNSLVTSTHTEVIKSVSIF